MINKSSCLLTVGIVSLSLIVSGIFSTVIAQEEASPLLGFWRQKGDSVYIHVTETEGIINAEIVRNDWSPGLVGEMVFQELTAGKKNRWEGKAFILGSDKLGKVKVTLKKNEVLETSVRPGPRKKFQWVRSEPVEKRL